MKNLKHNISIRIILIFTVLFSAKSFAASQTVDLPPCIVLKPAVQVSAPVKQINKNLNMLSGVPHLLIFDEKITGCKFENEKGFKSEMLTGIFNDRQELLISPLENRENKLTVRTASRIYNFNIKFKSSQTPNIRELPDSRPGVKSLKNTSDDEEFSLGEDEIDKPPVLPENAYGIADFDLDSPPKIKN